jgi:acetyl esterase
VRNFQSVAAKILAAIFLLVLILAAAAYAAWKFTPWPSALLIRRAFNKDDLGTAASLAKFVPAGVSSRLDVSYDPAEPDAQFDLFYPSQIDNTDRTLPTIVWIHGGGWIAGSKFAIANYAKILATAGYTTVAVDYSLAPGKIYPTPVRQINAALAFLTANSAHLHVDPARLFLAGDSAGAHIAAQLACVITSPTYAAKLSITASISPAQLRGVLLYCGPFKIQHSDLDSQFGGMFHTFLWSYSGEKDFLSNPNFATASVIDFITPQFPPTFISAGNIDPLLPQSQAFAKTLSTLCVPTETLFFPQNQSPPLSHEYQFDLSTDGAQQALLKSEDFLASHSQNP